MSERASRSLFFNELLILALPAVIILGWYAVMAGGWTLYG